MGTNWGGHAQRLANKRFSPFCFLDKKAEQQNLYEKQKLIMKSFLLPRSRNFYLIISPQPPRRPPAIPELSLIVKHERGVLVRSDATSPQALRPMLRPKARSIALSLSRTPERQSSRNIATLCGGNSIAKNIQSLDKRDKNRMGMSKRRERTRPPLSREGEPESFRLMLNAQC
jgi:hypothetical protein